MECDATGAIVSAWPPMIMTASPPSVHVLSEVPGASGTAAWMFDDADSASSEPPPPMEWPATPRREPSARERTADGADELTAQFSAAISCWPREAGWWRVLWVSMPTTTKPHDASRGPSQLMLDQRAVKPGEIETTGYVPAVVG